MTKENKKRVFLILLGLLLLTGWFYWFEYRPSKIRFSCHKWAKENSVILPDEAKEGVIYGKIYKLNYEACLHEKGLK